MNEDPCPHCRGKCCVDLDLGYRVSHCGAQFFEHACDFCVDGTKYLPPSPAREEREKIVRWIRDVASSKTLSSSFPEKISPATRSALLEIASRIEQKSHAGSKIF